MSYRIRHPNGLYMREWLNTETRERGADLTTKGNASGYTRRELADARKFAAAQFPGVAMTAEIR